MTHLNRLERTRCFHAVSWFPDEAEPDHHSTLKEAPLLFVGHQNILEVEDRFVTSQFFGVMDGQETVGFPLTPENFLDASYTEAFQSLVWKDKT